ncbi:conserved hypothetical protein [Methylocella silvestris BL2]|uniref:Uncharacterized protein n=1 Tax=Methylocella silvestris (strain DSM 15510 / CIP 108128 / LMG 27833 / NCIMB 13906 / BL2) TaxID=395965 RepID=B8ESE3_METSB|nr:hypothetical protein [Methylocella silvestris]ACK49833.1 conserved hypothetical protein [Methylocella silvestris BL2]
MNKKFLRCLAIAGALAVAPAAFAAGLDGFEYQKETSVTMKSGKTVTLTIGKMNGKTVVVLPMEDLSYLYERAEGHTMATGP